MLLKRAGYTAAGHGKITHGWDQGEHWDEKIGHKRDPAPPGAPLTASGGGERDWPRRLIVLLVSGIALGPTKFCRCHAADWPCIRGADHNGVSTESISEWPPAKSWEVDAGEGYSSVAVSDGRVYTMGWVAGQDKVSCFDAATGDMIWSQTYPCGYGGEIDIPRAAERKAGD